MPLTQDNIKNLVAGISQQPQILRYPEQLQEQKNGMSSGAEGLKKRPPTLHVANLLGINPKTPSYIGENVAPLVHVVERSLTEKYIMVFDGTGIDIFDTAGNAKTVNITSGTSSYITVAKPREQLKVTTIADYTFIANTEVNVAMSSAAVANVWSTQGALFNVKSGQYGRTYVCYIDDVQISTYTTPDGSSTSDTTKIDTNYIASQLIANITSGYYVESSGEGWFYVKKSSGATISTAATKDGYNNLAMYSFLHATQKFSNLPATAPDGFTVLVKGDSSTGTDDYYVKYSKSASLWKETAKPGILKSFNPTTMPHILVRESDGTFTFDVATWDEREVGDDDSNPEASFVGQAINDIFFIRNRLGLLAGENCIMSKAGEFFKFWLTTATDVLDSDYIDVSAPDESVAILRHATVFNEELLMFSTHAQFVGSSDTIFSPTNFRIDRSTKFDCIPHCRPVPAGRRIYFASERSEYSSLMEYYIVEDISEIKDAHDISSHVPSLMPNTIHQIIGSTTENVLLLLSTGNSKRIYIYKYLWQEETRVQASWSYWELASGEILGAGFIGSILYLVIKRNNIICLEKLVFTYDTLDYTVEPYRVYLDRKKTYTIPSGLYNADSDTTRVPITNFYGAAIPSGVSYGLVLEDGLYKSFTSADTYVEFLGDVTGSNLVVGEIIEFIATLSEIMIREDDGKGGVKANIKGRLQVRRAWVNYHDSGYFEVLVAQEGKDTYKYEMTARTLSKTNNTLGSMPLSTGVFNFPVQCDSREATITIQSSSPTPISLIGFGWEANHVERSAK